MNLETALITIKTTEDGIETTRHYVKANMPSFEEAAKCIEGFCEFFFKQTGKNDYCTAYEAAK